MAILKWTISNRKGEKFMKLYDVTHARKCAGGGYKKVPLTKLQKIGGQCSPSIQEGWCQAR